MITGGDDGGDGAAPNGVLAAAPAAMPQGGLVDTDGDLLPDCVELPLLLDPSAVDSDSDGIDDFLAAAQFRRPFDHPGSPRPMDDEMRVVVSASENVAGVESVWVHFLFRFVGANLGELRGITPFLDLSGTRYSFASMIGAGGVAMSTRVDPVEGLFCVASFELLNLEALRNILPCTVGATAMVGSRLIHSGAYLQDVAGVVTVLTAADDDKGMVVPLDPAATDDPFWTSARICVMQLEVMSTTPSGSLCEVRNAECMSSGRLACPPTCLQSRGSSMFFPNGLGTVTGSGR
ncbi:MAG: hypothetical protein AB7I19_04655 [Planctomycetota bacterium]